MEGRTCRSLPQIKTVSRVKTNNNITRSAKARSKKEILKSTLCFEEGEPSGRSEMEGQWVPNLQETFNLSAIRCTLETHEVENLKFSSLLDVCCT